MEDTIRKFQCGPCFCVFYLPDGIEPRYCPLCCANFNETQVMSFPDDEGLGEYLENEEGAA